MSFTIEHYNHIKENGFNPKICKECQEIDTALKSNAQLISDLYEALKGALWVLKGGSYGRIGEPDNAKPEAISRAEQSLARADEK